MIKNEARLFAKKFCESLDILKISADCVNEIISSDLLKEFKNVGIYYPLNNEMDLLNLIELYPNKNFYLPITNDTLLFAKYSLGDELKKGKFKVMEPLTEPIDLNLLDAIIIPCLAISNDNKRLGYGKGYYDQTLKKYQGFKIGVCPKELSYLDIQMEEYDLKLDYIVRG